MFISRRTLIGLLAALAAGFKTENRSEKDPESVFGYQLDDNVSLSLLESYARTLALKDSAARWEAQMMFHDAQIARRNGGTLNHKLGYRHKEFVEAHERDRLPVDKTGPWWT